MTIRAWNGVGLFIWFDFGLAGGWRRTDLEFFGRELHELLLIQLHLTIHHTYITSKLLAYIILYIINMFGGK